MKTTTGTVSGSLAYVAVAAFVSVSAAFVVDPADDDLALWLDASATGGVVTGVISGGMTYDSATFSAGGGAAQDGDPVALWHDRRTPGAGNTANLTKNSVFYSANNGSVGNTGLRPTYVADAYKGLPAVRFDGVDDLLITWDGAMPTLTEEHTIIVVGRAYSDSMGNYDNGSYLAYARYTGNATPQIGLDIMNTTADDGLRFRIKMDDLDTWSGSTTLLEEVDVLMQRRTDNGDTTYTVAGYVGGGIYGATNQLLVSGTSTGSTASTSPGFRIGRHTGGAQFLEADVFEILVYNRALGDSELTSLKQELYAKWSIPEPSSLALLALAGATVLHRRRG